MYTAAIFFNLSSFEISRSLLNFVRTEGRFKTLGQFVSHGVSPLLKVVRA
jgi:hypothetical protein